MTAYISELKPYGTADAEFIEISVPAGTDASGYRIALYNDSGSFIEEFSLGTRVGTIKGQDIYVIDSATTTGFDSTDSMGNLWPGDGLALVDDAGAVLQFVSYRGATVTASDGPAAGLTSTNLGWVGAGESLQSDDGGSTYFLQTAPNKGSIPCFERGTLIDTPGGPRPVEDLRPGDQVSTLWHGAQPIVWTRGSRITLPLDGQDAVPIRIRAGALGAGQPARDLTISPQHRILVGTQGQLDGFFRTPALATAKSLTTLPGVQRLSGRRSVSYHHFALARHEVVRANGALAETLLLGPMVLGGLPNEDRRELAKQFSRPVATDAALNGPAVVPCLKVGAVRKLLRGARSAELA